MLSISNRKDFGGICLQVKPILVQIYPNASKLVIFGHCGPGGIYQSGVRTLLFVVPDKDSEGVYGMEEAVYVGFSKVKSAYDERGLKVVVLSLSY